MIAINSQSGIFFIPEPLCLDGIEQLAPCRGRQLIPTFKGWHQGLQKQVTVRLFNTALVADLLRRSILRALAQQIIQCRHPGITEWLEFKKIRLQDEEYYCLTSEWFSDGSLKDLLACQGAFSEENVFLIIEHAVDVLGYLWDKTHIAHGNLKPRNILVDTEGTLKLDGFGLPVLLMLVAENSLKLGVPAFMAPELKAGRPTRHPDHLSDIYALGMTVCCLLAKPTDVSSAGREEQQEINKILVSILPEMGKIVRRMIAEKREERFQSWAEVRSAIEEYKQTCR